MLEDTLKTRANEGLAVLYRWHEQDARFLPHLDAIKDYLAVLEGTIEFLAAMAHAAQADGLAAISSEKPAEINETVEANEDTSPDFYAAVAGISAELDTLPVIPAEVTSTPENAQATVQALADSINKLEGPITVKVSEDTPLTNFVKAATAAKVADLKAKTEKEAKTAPTKRRK